MPAILLPEPLKVALDCNASLMKAEYDNSRGVHCLFFWSAWVWLLCGLPTARWRSSPDIANAYFRLSERFLLFHISVARIATRLVHWQRDRNAFRILTRNPCDSIATIIYRWKPNSLRKLADSARCSSQTIRGAHFDLEKRITVIPPSAFKSGAVLEIRLQSCHGS